MSNLKKPSTVDICEHLSNNNKFLSIAGIMLVIDVALGIVLGMQYYGNPQNLSQKDKKAGIVSNAKTSSKNDYNNSAIIFPVTPGTVTGNILTKSPTNNRQQLCDALNNGDDVLVEEACKKELGKGYEGYLKQCLLQVGINCSGKTPSQILAEYNRELN